MNPPSSLVGFRTRSWEGTVCIIALIFLLLIGGCDTSVDPILGTDQGFTVWGVLNPKADTQWVRIFPVEETINALNRDSLTAKFTSVGHQTGSSRTWNYRRTTDPGGLPAHLYYAEFQPNYGETYTLTAFSEARGSTAVEVRVPARANLELQTLRKGPTLPVLVRNQSPGSGSIDRIVSVTARYRVQFYYSDQVDTIPRVTLSITKVKDITPVDSGWRVDLNLRNHFLAIKDTLRRRSLYSSAYGIGLWRDIFIDVLIGNKEWDPPGGTFNPDELIHPATMSNIQGGERSGLGFIGAGYELTVDVSPTRETKRWIGFRETVKD